jgi:hypothetical protein
VYSNLTPNLPYYFGQPVEKVWTENWGNWIFFGHVGVASEGFDMTDIDPLADPPTKFINAVNLHTTHDPMAQVQGAANCPYNAFYPQPGSNCSCHAEVTSGMVWWAYEYSSFEWDAMSLWQLSGRGAMKPFGPNTRMRLTIRCDTSPDIFAIGIKTARMGTMDKAWTWIVQMPDVDTMLSDGDTVQLDFNLMQRINAREPGGYVYNSTTIDSMMALYIYSTAQETNNWFCQAVDGPGGSFLPSSCFADRCIVKDSDIYIGPIELYEPTIV